MRKLLVAVLLVGLFAAPASAQFGTGVIGGTTLFLVDGEIISVGEILAEMGYRFPISYKHEGELVMLFGAQVSEAAIGGMLYRHYFNAIPENKVMPGVTLGGFVIGNESASQLTTQTVFLGGGFNLDICPNETDHFTAYAEIFGGVYGDTAQIVRFGLRASG